jgi:hypothetical protein
MLQQEGNLKYLKELIMKAFFKNIFLDYYLPFLCLILGTSYFFLDYYYIDRKILKIAQLFVVLILFFNVKNYKRINKVFIYLIAAYIIGNFSKLFINDLQLSSLLFPSGITLILVLIIFCDKNVSETKKIFNNYLSFFVIINVPALILWFLIFFNFDLSYNVIQLNERTLNYRNYYNVAVFCDWIFYNWNGITITRLNGLFEEPGMFGTYSIIMLAIDEVFFKNKKRQILLIIFGLLTFSLTFYLLLLPFLIYKSQKHFIRILFSILIFFIAIYDQIKFVIEPLILSRFGRGGNILGISRQSDFDKFLIYIDNIDFFSFIIGNGIGSNRLEETAQFSSVFQFIYELGFLGSIFLFIFLISVFIVESYKIFGLKILLLTMIPIFSILQRPDFGSSVMIIFIVLLIKTKQQTITINPNIS